MHPWDLPTFPASGALAFPSLAQREVSLCLLLG